MEVPFLSNLGVTDVAQSVDPTAAAFPQAFNINSQGVWDSTISQIEMTKDKALNWGMAIKTFIANCVEQDIFPFSNLKQAPNDRILSELQHARRAIVKFLDDSRMLDLVDLRATKREVLVSNVGFTLRVYGDATLKDPTFEQWLGQKPSPSFSYQHGNVYAKHLAHGVTMMVHRTANRWRVGYEITSHHFPQLPGNHVPSKAELEKFVLDLLWMPVLRTHRPQGYHHRLI